MAWTDDLRQVNLQWLLLLQNAGRDNLLEAALRFGTPSEVVRRVADASLADLIEWSSGEVSVVQMRPAVVQVIDEQAVERLGRAAVHVLMASECHGDDGHTVSESNDCWDDNLLCAFNLAYLMMLRGMYARRPAETLIRFGLSKSTAQNISKASPTELRCWANRKFVLPHLRPAFGDERLCATGAMETVCTTVRAACEAGRTSREPGRTTR